jgi:hypothetical protein
MTFSNSRNIIASRLLLFLATFPFGAFLFLTFIEKVIRFPLLGFNEAVWVGSLSVIYFLIAYYPTILKYNFIYFSDDGQSIILRYYSTGIFKGKRNSVEIPKGSYAGYTKGNRLPFMIPYIVLLEKRKGITASYPPVYLSALSRNERRKMFRTLETYKPGQ